MNLDKSISDRLGSDFARAHVRFLNARIDSLSRRLALVDNPPTAVDEAVVPYTEGPPA